ncbi:hypothetical protein K501DRAFT_319746 [Backusella circina FSU 941]|nr:hypothetical protein K501DRAFT_319746 [Backusella circina FSU 941]
MINTVILYGNCALFVRVLHFIPYGSVLAFFICCIVMSYYCFEYKWIHQDWSIEQRMIYAEQHWAYCLGFGLPATIVTFFLSTLRSGGVFALVYPSYVIMASVATPLPEMVGNDPSIHTTPHNVSLSNSDFALPFRIPVFFGVRLMNQLIVNGIRVLGGSRGAFIVSEKKKDRMGKLV